jgi:hypothetical protein
MLDVYLGKVGLQAALVHKSYNRLQQALLWQQPILPILPARRCPTPQGGGCGERGIPSIFGAYGWQRWSAS